MLIQLALYIAPLFFLCIRFTALPDKAGNMVNIIDHFKIVRDQIKRRTDIKNIL